MYIALHTKQVVRDILVLIERLVEIARYHQAQVMVSQNLIEELKSWEFDTSYLQVFVDKKVPSYLNLMVSIGGDGTLLDSVTYIGDTEIPLLGINTGSLGFLATVAQQDGFTALWHFFQGRYTIDKRTMLALHTSFDKPVFALNEIAILKKDSSSMITIYAYIDDILISVYWADGLIIATPTGSTGYSLSCMGPIILPTTHSLVITPVNPHNLSVRPLIIPDNSKLTFTIKSRSQQILVAIDGRSTSISADVTLTVTKAHFILHLVKVGTTTIFDILRKKLHWGTDARNHLGYHQA